jgi:hypothetical protein
LHARTIDDALRVSVAMEHPMGARRPSRPASRLQIEPLARCRVSVAGRISASH